MQEDRLQKLLDFLTKDPADPFLKYALATEYLKMDNPDMALKYFQDLVSNHEDYVGTYYHLGKLYETLGRRDDALRVYQQGIEVARKARNNHAMAELNSAYLSLAGLDFEDD